MCSPVCVLVGVWVGESVLVIVCSVFVVYAFLFLYV